MKKIIPIILLAAVALFSFTMTAPKEKKAETSITNGAPNQQYEEKSFGGILAKEEVPF